MSLRTQAEFNPIRSSVSNGVVHSFLGDTKEMPLDLKVQSGKGAIVFERAGDVKLALNIECQGFKHHVETGVVQANRVRDRGQGLGPGGWSRSGAW